jgi:hypothetical protein
MFDMYALSSLYYIDVYGDSTLPKLFDMMIGTLQFLSQNLFLLVAKKLPVTEKFKQLFLCYFNHTFQLFELFGQLFTTSKQFSI